MLTLLPLLAAYGVLKHYQLCVLENNIIDEIEYYF